MLDDLFSQVQVVEIYCAVSIEHTIITNNPSIMQINRSAYSLLQMVVNSELDKVLELRVVEKSKKFWSSPILSVPKKNKTYGFCVDYLCLNHITEKDAYSLPYVNNILDILCTDQFLTSLDIKSAF